MRKYVTPDQPNICNPTNLTKAANRVRTQIRPQEPRDLQFEVISPVILLDIIEKCIRRNIDTCTLLEIAPLILLDMI